MSWNSKRILNWIQRKSPRDKNHKSFFFFPSIREYKILFTPKKMVITVGLPKLFTLFLPYYKVTLVSLPYQNVRHIHSRWNWKSNVWFSSFLGRLVRNPLLYIYAEPDKGMYELFMWSNGERRRRKKEITRKIYFQIISTQKDTKTSFILVWLIQAKMAFVPEGVWSCTTHMGKRLMTVLFFEIHLAKWKIECFEGAQLLH